MQNSKLKKITLSAVFLAIGIVLPLYFGQIKEIGDSLLPMHLPVMLCGLLCGWQYGLVVGLILPFMRSVLFSMPPVYPVAVYMSLELAAYGFTIGFLYRRFRRKNIVTLYLSLLLSMIAGRVVWGIAKSVLLGVGGKRLTAEAFITGAVIDALPGIVLQLILIPIIMGIIEHKTFWPKRKRKDRE